MTPSPYSRGELGKLACEAAVELERLGWRRFFHSQQRPHSVSPTIHGIKHPVAPYLTRLAMTGVPLICSDPPWPIHLKDTVYHRGPHKSAVQDYAAFLLEDMWDYVHMGYWVVLPYHSIRTQPHLRLAPAGVVPQRERRPRPIMDYSFFGTNAASVPLHPHHAMQFGSTLQRILQRLVYCNPSYGPPLLAKLDLADGYYRVPLSPEAALHLAVVIPSDIDSEFLTAVPLTLPMGWAQSPPYFCAFTETVADLSNFGAHQHLPPHALLESSQHFEQSIHNTFHEDAIVLGEASKPPLSYTDVYIDDFLAVAQAPKHTTWLNSLFHALDSVFQDDPNSPRRQVVSASKLAKGDACFSTEKRILGWDIDTYHMLLRLPQHRLDHLVELLTDILAKRRLSRKRWQKLLGFLRSTSPALYGAQHLFSVLQYPLRQPHHRIRLTTLLKALLNEWLHLAKHAARIPTPLLTTVPRCPTILAATDAAKAGMGGFWVSTPLHGPPSYNAWRHPFPDTIQDALITQHNPKGVITNSDLELAATITGAVLAQHYADHHHPHIALATDNTNACAWLRQGSTTSIQAPAFLLHLLSRLRRAQPFSVLPFYTPGTTNIVADCCSRLFHLDDNAFIHYLNTNFPTQLSWTLVTPPSALISNMNCALLSRLPPQELQQNPKLQVTPAGTCGRTSAETFTVIPTSKAYKIPSHFYKSLHTATEQAKWLPAVLKCALEPWREPFVPLARRLPHWDSVIPAYNNQES
jgi:hypothetical protein